MVSVKAKLVAASAVVLLSAVGAAVAELHRAPAESSGGVLVIERGTYYCPMHTHVTSDHEGSCPICGMKLVRRSELPTGAAGPEGMVVAPPMLARLGVVVEAVRLRDFSPSVEIAAQVVADESRAVTLSPKVEGWVKRLGVSVVGQPVRMGQVLYEIYSPELQERQRDYLDLLTRRDALLAAKDAAGGMSAGNSPPDLMLASVARERYRARNRLIAADVPASVMDDLEQFRRVHDVIPVVAAHDGVITGIGAREGAYVRPGEVVVSYADRHAAWAELTMPPLVLAQIRNGDEVELVSGVEGHASVSSRVNPAPAVIDPVSRTARVRVPLPGAASGFLPGMLLEGYVHMRARRALTVPVDAVLRTGRGDFVMLADSDNHFERGAVRLGVESGDRVEVVEGLRPGQEVVTNGQFMLSAESSLQSSWSRLAAEAHAH